MPRKAVLDSMEQSAVSNSFLFQCSRLLADLRGCLNLRILEIRLTHILHFNPRFLDSVEAPESMKY